MPVPVYARTWKVYSVPLSRFDAVNVVVVALLPDMGVQLPQLPPPSVLRRRCQPEMPLSFAASQANAASVSPGVAERFAGFAGAIAMSKVSVSVSVAASLLSLSVTVYVYAVAACDRAGVPLNVRVPAV